jgi:hypothetical protein
MNCKEDETRCPAWWRVLQSVLQGGGLSRVYCKEEGSAECTARSRVQQSVLQGGGFSRVYCKE